MSEYFYKFLSLLHIRTYRSFRLTIRAGALVAGLYAALRMSEMVQQNRFPAAGLVLLGVLAAGFVEFIAGDVLADRSFPLDTERKLVLMEKRLGAETINNISERLQEMIRLFQACDQSQIRGAVHVFVPLIATADQRVRRGLLQLTDYVGGTETSRGKGRITLVNQGIIGRCARTGKMETVGFADESDYREAMVREFGFTVKEAEKHTKTARSYLAYPLNREGEVVGVLYFFSNEPQVFPRAADEAQLDQGARDIVRHLRLVPFI
jgi:hypothetical protein